MQVLQIAIASSLAVLLAASASRAQPVPVGSVPFLHRTLSMPASSILGIAWHQGQLWTADNSGDLRRIDPLTGAVLQTESTGKTTHNGLGSNGPTLFMTFDPGGTKVVSVLPLGTPGNTQTSAARDLAFIGNDMWYADPNADAIVGPNGPAIGSATGTSSVANGLEWDGAHLIHVEHDRSLLYLYDPGSLALDATIDLAPLGIDIAGGLAWDGEEIYAADGGKLYVIGFGGQWDDLGYGLGGTNGVPKLTGSGHLDPGSVIELELTQARAFATATLVVGLSAIYAPFRGGVLVPNPDLLITMFTGSGQIPLSAPWPPGVPAGTTLCFQYWVSDPMGPKGFAASNGLQLTVH